MSTTDRQIDRPTATYPTNPFAGWRDRTPTGQVPPISASRPGQPSPSQHEAEPGGPSQHEVHYPAIQDMGRPGLLSRPSMAWHPSLMQLAIGAALVVAMLASLQLLALDGIYSARQAAIGQARGATAGPSQPAPSPASKPGWTVHGTGAPYDRTDPSASPLDLPACTTAPDTPMPCLASLSSDGSRAVVLEEDASLTGLDLR